MRVPGLSGTFPIRIGFSFVAGRQPCRATAYRAVDAAAGWQKGDAMGAIMSGIPGAPVFGALAAIVLSAVPEPPYEPFSTPTTRLTHPPSHPLPTARPDHPTAPPT